MDGEILEGFLCPVCKEDLKSPERLTNHVEQQHAEEQIILKSLKEIFGFARKKILNSEESTNLSKALLDSSLSLKSNIFVMSKIDTPSEDIIQEIGGECDHIAYFKAVRNPRLERYATETNKLVIRLHKLLRDRPRDPIQRKMHEQERVPWLDGKDVKLCPNCARTFHFTRRQHHCRLCGSIMCHDCSYFLRIDVAECLLNSSGDSPTEMKALTSDKEADYNTLRICEHCLHLLENRKEMQDRTTFSPLITHLYDHILELKHNIAPDIPIYCRIVSSLYEGDSIFTLADASALRSKIGIVAEQVDNTSKSILTIPAPQGSRSDALKKALRLACVTYIKEELLSLPQLPLEDEIDRLQRKRCEETEMRIEQEREMATQALERYEQSRNFSSGTTTPCAPCAVKGSAVASLDNWSGYYTDTSGPNSDPLVEQINIIKGYIKQARQALRFEEVATLEKNLRELQQEFYHRQNSRH
ncbi:rabenosyn-5 [Phlebotomus papatasi]|uniref:rabenosyn-5 n=1 Tax=Phlebotomus papatasi TaxID=29031 RepID=UPI002483830A|nr:rabenosyn-5 [Phlebotomus papatasi]